MSALGRAYSDTGGAWEQGPARVYDRLAAVLIDWAYVGEGPACHELAWHLALDRSRLPASKEATAEAFRAGLERHGVDTGAWWDRQLSLCLLGAVVQFGWEKARGDGDELSWWCQAASKGAERL